MNRLESCALLTLRAKAGTCCSQYPEAGSLAASAPTAGGSNDRRVAVPFISSLSQAVACSLREIRGSGRLGSLLGGNGRRGLCGLGAKPGLQPPERSARKQAQRIGAQGGSNFQRKTLFGVLRIDLLPSLADEDPRAGCREDQGRTGNSEQTPRRIGFL